MKDIIFTNMLYSYPTDFDSLCTHRQKVSKEQNLLNLLFINLKFNNVSKLSFVMHIQIVCGGLMQWF